MCCAQADYVFLVKISWIAFTVKKLLNFILTVKKSQITRMYPSTKKV